MSRVLAYTSPARGHLYPLMSILLQLRESGHDVAVRTLASEVPLVREQGLSAEPIDPRIEAIPLDDWHSRSATKALAASVRGSSSRAEFDAADLAAAIRAEEPDAVIVDVNSWGASAAAERWGGPWASFCPCPAPLRSHDVPPFGPGMGRRGAPSAGSATGSRAPSCEARSSGRCWRP
jgi:UDP:flavonoid glycosyltransferase YjiC (YdhE family)